MEFLRPVEWSEAKKDDHVSKLHESDWLTAEHSRGDHKSMRLCFLIRK